MSKRQRLPGWEPPEEFWARADVIRASGVSESDFSNWTSRQPPILPPSVRGIRNQFSYNRVVMITIMTRLTQLGWGATPAAYAAMEFADVGEGVTYWVGEPEPEPEAQRQPAALFDTGRTLLVARLPDKAETPDDLAAIAAVINVQPQHSWSDVSALIEQQLRVSPCQAAVIILELDTLVAQVRDALGLPRD